MNQQEFLIGLVRLPGSHKQKVEIINSIEDPSLKHLTEDYQTLYNYLSYLLQHFDICYYPIFKLNTLSLSFDYSVKSAKEILCKPKAKKDWKIPKVFESGNCPNYANIDIDFIIAQEEYSRYTVQWFDPFVNQLSLKDGNDNGYKILNREEMEKLWPRQL